MAFPLPNFAEKYSAIKLFRQCIDIDGDGNLYFRIGADGLTVTADTEFPTAAALNGTWAKTTVSTISGAALMANDGTNEVLLPGDTTNGLTVNTELTAPAALADALANPTISNISSLSSAFNGTTWDRVRSGQTSNSTTVTGFVNTLGMARYNASPTARTEGQFGNLQADAGGNLLVSLGALFAGEDQTNNLLQTVSKPIAVSTYSPDQDTSAAAEASSVTKASSGNLYGVTATNSSGGSRYWQMFNSTTVPADTTVPIISILVVSGGTIRESWPMGKNFSTGMAWCWSTTAATKTIGSTDGIATVDYK